MPEPAGLRQKQTIRCGGLALAARRAPLVMGILNVTPDSFSDGGDFIDPGAASRRALDMEREGADVIDIGGESSRPGAERIPARVESERVLPVVRELAAKLTVPMSIDTCRPEVAAAALDAGCRMVNDVTACRHPEMPDVLQHYDVPVVLMHMLGDPDSMQAAPSYDDVVEEVFSYLRERVEFLTGRGIAGERVIVDPGIGFGKRFRDNLDLLGSATRFYDLGHPLLIGASRKRFLGELLRAPAAGRLTGSLAVAARCYQMDVDMVRVHDVKETVELFRVLDAMDRPGEYRADW
ncbi:MAG: dihydropteroate synthase [Candidatus Krumholzibacteriia bacterium]